MIPAFVGIALLAPNPLTIAGMLGVIAALELQTRRVEEPFARRGVSGARSGRARHAALVGKRPQEGPHAQSRRSQASAQSEPSPAGRCSARPSPAAVISAASTESGSGRARCSAITAATSAVVRA
jgi:hypothetical protein